MLSSLFGKKSDHPLGEIKSVQALLDDLPKNDAHKSLVELTGWIESASANGDFRLDHQFAVLRLLDEAARPYARKLAHDYFTPHELNKFQENRLWLALGNWSQHTGNAYYRVFDRYCGGDKGGGAIKAQVPLLAARTVHAMAGQLKYICARYSTADKTIWEHLAQLCRHAEQQQYLDTPVNLYPGATGTTTVKYELAHLLGWHGCGVGALSPLHMHLTERIAAQFCSGMDIGARQDSGSLFSFDLLHPVAPTRVKPEGAHPSMRFISMAAMRPKLEALGGALEKNIVPEELNLGRAYDAEVVREAVQHLLGYLVAPPSRRNPRRRASGYLNVVCGFAGLVEYANAAPGSRDKQPLRWEMEDISANGFRTALPAQGTDGIRIGSLIGVQPDGVPHWGAAIVRRLVRDDTGELQVGAEMLANRVAGVAVGRSGGGAFEDARPALWLCGTQGDASGEAQLLMGADTFSERYSLHTRLDGKNYLLIPGRLQEKGIDYDLVRFRAIVREKDTE
ncbi:MAG: hypothetical protein EPN14_06075 [Gallionella sp.]|nr:MAG: hypothetical protein EPN14_06075 [Gallionella sp.]